MRSLPSTVCQFLPSFPHDTPRNDATLEKRKAALRDCQQCPSAVQSELKYSLGTGLRRIIPHAFLYSRDPITPVSSSSSVQSFQAMDLYSAAGAVREA